MLLVRIAFNNLSSKYLNTGFSSFGSHVYCNGRRIYASIITNSFKYFDVIYTEMILLATRNHTHLTAPALFTVSEEKETRGRSRAILHVTSTNYIGIRFSRLGVS